MERQPMVQLVREPSGGRHRFARSVLEKTTKESIMAETATKPKAASTAASNGASNGHGSDEEGRRAAQAIADDKAANAPTGEEDDGQLFVIEEGAKVTLGTLIKRGTSLFYEFKLGGKAIKGAGGMGLLSFDQPDMTLVVPGRAGKVEVDPTYDGEGKIKHVTVRAHFKPSTIYDGRSSAGRAALLGE
jgi:hypothetical protein